MIQNTNNQMVKGVSVRSSMAEQSGLQPWAVKLALRAQAALAGSQAVDVSVIRVGEGRYIRVNGGDLEKVG